MSSRYWYSVDSDDLHHHPTVSGHPTRSAISPWCLESNIRPMSDLLMNSFRNLEKWWVNRSEDEMLTIFVIGEQLEDPKFVNVLLSLKNSRPGLTIGVHGLKHICWSAWGIRSDEFEIALSNSMSILRRVAGSSFRPWFRAPGGYIAPWMIPVMKKHGIVLDSSINPIWLLRRKSGKDENGRNYGWREVRSSLNENQIIEREWLVKHGMPTNGPALHIPMLRDHSKWVWKRELSNSRCVTEKELLDSSIYVNSIYWHVLDHGREGGWVPPIP